MNDVMSKLEPAVLSAPANRQRAMKISIIYYAISVVFTWQDPKICKLWNMSLFSQCVHLEKKKEFYYLTRKVGDIVTAAIPS